MGNCHCGEETDEFYILSSEIEIKIKEIKVTNETFFNSNLEDLTNPDRIQNSSEKIDNLKRQVDLDFRNLEDILSKQKTQNPKDSFKDKENDIKKLREKYFKAFEINENQSNQFMKYEINT